MKYKENVKLPVEYLPTWLRESVVFFDYDRVNGESMVRGMLTPTIRKDVICVLFPTTNGFSEYSWCKSYVDGRRFVGLKSKKPNKQAREGE